MISLKGLETLKALMKRKLGIDLSSYKQEFIARRVYARMAMLGIDTVEEYARYVAKHSEELEKLLEILAINVSEFFRDGMKVWSKFSEVLELVFSRNRAVKIWSAGCAHGEEPYTIAILVKEVLGPRITAYNVVIYGTDIDSEALRRAREGVYSYSQVRNVPKNLLVKYFDRVGDRYRVREDLKKMVRFVRHDLVRDPPLSFVDIVVCRNVLIYFNRDTQAKVLRSFYNSLKTSGFLMLGLSEAVFDELEKLFVPFDIETKIYVKRGYVGV